MNYLYAALAAIAILIGVEQFGEHRIQTLWDLETERIEAIAKQEKENDRKAIDAISEQHRKDIQNAKSEAGKSAVREYLRTHGMLPSQGSDNQAANTEGISNSSCKCGASVETEEFAERCGEDALKLLRVTEWALRESLEAE